MNAMVFTLARILLATPFIISGAQKAMNLAGTAGYITSKGLPYPDAIAMAVVALEVAGGLALIFNILRVPVALLFAAFCIAAGVIFHNFWAVDAAQYNAQLIQFMKNVSIAGGFLAVAAWSDGRD